jgi:hypothetical protein
MRYLGGKYSWRYGGCTIVYLFPDNSKVKPRKKNYEKQEGRQLRSEIR